MITGTEYTDKNLLLTALERIKANSDFLSTSDKIQQSDKDIVESLWNRGASVVELADYTDLTDLISGNTLQPGQHYSVPYQGVHVIPGTANVLNTASSEYVEVIETFIVKAVDSNSIDPFVHSLDNPNDIIIWDVSANTAEDGSTARSGKIRYREDKINRLSTYYDFRSVYFRRGTFDETGAVPAWTTGQNWTRGDFAYFPTNVLKRACFDMSPDSTGDAFKWQDIGPGTTTLKWVWKDSATYAGGTVPRKDTADYLTFQGGATNVHIDYTSTNNGYNNIVVNNCSNLVLGPGSYDSHIETCSNVIFENSVVNSLVGVVSNSTFLKASSSYIWACTNFEANDLSNDSYYGCNEINLSPGSEGNNVSFTRRGNLGANLNNNSIHYCIDSDLGSGIVSNIFRNIEQTHMASSITNNSFLGFKYCDVKNEVNNCSFTTEPNQYGIYEYVTIGENCSSLSADNTASVDRVVFGKSCNNIVVTSGGTLDNVEFGPECVNHTISNGASIRNTRIDSECISFTLDNNSSINRTTIGSAFNTLVMDNSSTITDVKIGPNCSNWDLGSSSSVSISKSLFGTGAIVTMDTGSTIVNSWIGENLTNLTITGTSTLRDSFLHNNIGALSITTGSTIESSQIGKTSSLTLSNSSVILDSIIGPDCDALVITDAANVSRSVFEPGFKNKTLDGTANTNFSDYTFKRNSESVTLDNSTNYAKTTRIVEPSVAANVLAIDMFAAVTYDFAAANAADLDVELTGTPGNVDISFTIENTDASPHDITFSDTGGSTTSVVDTLPATTKRFYSVRRILTSTDDELVITQTATLS